MKNTTTTLELISAKYYQIVFKIARNAAQKWFKEDLHLLGRNRMTLEQFNKLYTDIQPLIKQNYEQSKRAD